MARRRQEAIDIVVSFDILSRSGCGLLAYIWLPADVGRYPTYGYLRLERK